jgi:hypothetical protein
LVEPLGGKTDIVVGKGHILRTREGNEKSVRKYD